jgi:hypothetical protein
MTNTPRDEAEAVGYARGVEAMREAAAGRARHLRIAWEQNREEHDCAEWRYKASAAEILEGVIRALAAPAASEKGESDG